jgi:two-component system KDP operon response regulator KdpE
VNTDSPTRVLLVDDEPQLIKALTLNLRARDYEVDTAPDGATALKIAAIRPPDLVVLDLGLPDMDGVDVITALRGWSSAPIVVLSGRVGSGDKVRALDAGADDYVTKPFGVDELLARLRALARRGTPPTDPQPIQLGDVLVDLTAKTAVRQTGARADDVRLTPTEWHLLEILLRNPGRLVSQRELLREVWGPNYYSETGYLRVYVAQLRRKLEPDPSRPRYLITESGMGYRYQP